MAPSSTNSPVFPSPGFTLGDNRSDANPTPPSGQQLVNSKIMVVAVAVLFAVVVFIFCLHIYAKWFWQHQDTAVLGLSRSSGSWRRRRSSRRSSSDALADHHHPPLFVLQSVGLEKSVVESLPTFVYKKEDFVHDADASESLPQQQQQLECAVCLEEFKDNETGRALPKCGHCFHVECIDMWFHSHSSCPLCRTSARPDDQASTEKPSPALALTAGVADDSADGENADPAASTMDSSLATPTAGRNLQRQEVETDNRQQQQQQNGTWKPQPQIPPNVLFWGVGVGSTSEQQEATSQHLRAQAAATASGRSSARLRAPFQVAIDIPQGGSTAETTSSPSFSTPKSPMARFMSFTRLLSRGKSIAAATAAASPSSTSSSSSSSPSILHLPADSEQAPAPPTIADP